MLGNIAASLLRINIMEFIFTNIILPLILNLVANLIYDSIKEKCVIKMQYYWEAVITRLPSFQSV